MQFNFTLKDLNDAFKEYCEDLVENIDNHSEEQKKENFQYIKAIDEFIFWFIDEYLNDYYIDNYEEDLKTVYDSYKLRFSKSYDVKAYGEEYDASTADPVILKGIIAADEEELRRKVYKEARSKSRIYNLVSFEVLNISDL